jgi:uncharacterized protein YpmS
MTEDLQPRRRKLKWLWLVLAAIATLLAVLIMPPLVNMSRYKSQITQLISTSLGSRRNSTEEMCAGRPSEVEISWVIWLL